MLHQTRREFNRSLWVAYVDLKAAFDSVDRNALWDLLTSLGIAPMICSMFVALYTNTISCVRVDSHNSEWFPVMSGVRQGCTVATDLFLVPMDWLMEHTSHHGMIGTTIGMEKEPLTDLDFADDVALLAEMLSMLVLALEVINAEAQPLGMTINWSKTKIQDLGGCGAPCQRASVQGNEVEVEESFVYLGSLIHCSGGSKLEIKWRTAFTRESMFALDHNIWGSGITLETKHRLYNTCILPIFLYGSEIWCLTSTVYPREEDRCTG